MSDSDKTIRFIDSDYKELFKIPDGGTIKTIYPPEDQRGTLIRACKYIDEYHFRLFADETVTKSFGTIFHIAEFAERMENMRVRYEPGMQLQNMELAPFSPGEEKLFSYNREDGNTCVGHIAGDFGNDGERFNSSWRGRENDRNTAEFHTELHSAVYALRQDLLKDYDSMSAYCESHPEAMIDSGETYKRYGFKLETDTRQYFVSCFLGESMRDARFITFAYDKPAPELEMFEPMSDWSMAKDYQGAEPFSDGSRPLLAETSLADVVISGVLDKDEAFIGVYSYGNFAENYYEGYSATKESACQIGADIVKHINANTDAQFTDGSFRKFFDSLQLSNVNIQDSMSEVSVQQGSVKLPSFGVVTPATADESKMFYRNSEPGNLCIGRLRGDFGSGGNEFWHSWEDVDKGRNTPEFKAEFQDVMNTLRKEVLKDLRSTQGFCYKNPEAGLPGDTHYYGFKVETETRQFFVRCTTLRDDYFYVYAYDKNPAREQERSAEDKSSVIKQIRDAEKAPKTPRKAKAPDKSKKKDGEEL